MKGTLYGIGVGPGDSELMTLKAVRLCRSSHIIAIAHKNPEKCVALKIALGAVPELAEKPIVCVDMPMTKDADILERAHQAGANAIAELLEQGKDVAFLTLGDPSVYSTYFYIHQRLAVKGYATVVVPGITSFCAAAAALGEPLCMNAEQLHIIPGTYDLSAVQDYQGTKILMKNDISEVRRVLTARNAQAYMVENCSTPEEKIYKGTENFPDTAGYYTLFVAKDK